MEHGINPSSSPKGCPMVNGFKKKKKRLNINKSHTHSPAQTKKKRKKEKKKTLDIPDYSPEWNPGTALTAQISLLQSHHKHALLLNKQKKIIIIFLKRQNKKLVLITFLTIHNYSKLTSIERGRGHTYGPCLTQVHVGRCRAFVIIAKTNFNF